MGKPRQIYDITFLIVRETPILLREILSPSRHVNHRSIECRGSCKSAMNCCLNTPLVSFGNESHAGRLQRNTASLHKRESKLLNSSCFKLKDCLSRHRNTGKKSKKKFMKMMAIEKGAKLTAPSHAIGRGAFSPVTLFL